VTTFLVAHGAWSAGWAWKKMHPLLAARGHALVTPTLTGLGDRAHLAHAGIDLDHHIRDILAVIDMEDLSAIALIGHSYGGMVATGVADRARDRVARLIYLDAFAPRDGDSVFSLSAGPYVEERLKAAATEGDGWRLPPNPAPPDTAPEDLAWINARRLPQPLETFRQPLTMTGGPLTLPVDYIYAGRIGPGDRFRPFLRKAQDTEDWRAHEIDASHSPHVTAPEALAELLDGIVRS